MKVIKDPTKAQMWAACALTVGEFVASGWLLIHDGHSLALYLAVTYAMRETSGGRHYHTVLVEVYRKVLRKCKPKEKSDEEPE